MTLHLSGTMPPRRTLGNLPRERAVRCTCDVGHTVQDGVLDAPTVSSVGCDAGGAFSEGHTCRPVKWALPTLANTERPHHEVLHGETGDVCLPKRFQRRRQAPVHSVLLEGRTDGPSHPVGECASPSLAVNRSFHECLHLQQRVFPW